MPFIRKTEDFICEHCNNQTIGDGYTNHCPVCLWSKHVDMHPGDRAALCKGLMRPVDLIKKRGREQIVHKCTLCGYKKSNRLDGKDNYDELVRIMKIDPKDR